MAIVVKAFNEPLRGNSKKRLGSFGRPKLPGSLRGHASRLLNSNAGQFYADAVTLPKLNRVAMFEVC